MITRLTLVWSELPDRISLYLTLSRVLIQSTILNQWSCQASYPRRFTETQTLGFIHTNWTRQAKISGESKISQTGVPNPSKGLWRIQGRAPPSVQILSISCSFWQNCCKIIDFHIPPPLGNHINLNMKCQDKCKFALKFLIQLSIVVNLYFN